MTAEAAEAANKHDGQTRKSVHALYIRHEQTTAFMLHENLIERVDKRAHLASSTAEQITTTLYPRACFRIGGAGRYL